MDTDFKTTQDRYEEFMLRTPIDIEKSVESVTDNQRVTFNDLVKSAKRIIFTGTGSSMPASIYGMNELQGRGLPAMFLPLGSLLNLKKTNSDDLIVLCSQGMNRADASLTVKFAKERSMPIVIVTANRETRLTDGSTLVCYFLPEQEKLFCRPDGVSSNLATMAALIDKSLSPELLVDAWRLGVENPIEFHKDMRYITLASSNLLPSNWNTALALREGSGVLAQNFDIETYAHGNYVGDITHKPFEYIVLTMDRTTESARSVRRFMPFIDNSEIPATVIDAPFSIAAQANLYCLGVIAQSVYDYNNLSLYNMNRPDGKEANRYYHDLESYEL